MCRYLPKNKGSRVACAPRGEATGRDLSCARADTAVPTPLVVCFAPQPPVWGRALALAGCGYRARASCSGFTKRGLVAGSRSPACGRRLSPAQGVGRDARATPLPWRCDPGRVADRRGAWRADWLAEVVADAHDHRALDDEGDQTHRCAAVLAAQRRPIILGLSKPVLSPVEGDLVDARDEPRPLACAWRRGGGGLRRQAEHWRRPAQPHACPEPAEGPITAARSPPGARSFGCSTGCPGIEATRARSHACGANAPW